MRRLLIVLTLVVALGFATTGCKKSEEPAAAPAIPELAPAAEEGSPTKPEEAPAPEEGSATQPEGSAST